MDKIYKYPIPIQHHFSIDLPIGCKILAVQVQREIPCIWVLVNENPPHPREFQLVGTGHPIEDSAGLHYIGTFQMDGGTFVFHLFEEMKAPVFEEMKKSE